MTKKIKALHSNWIFASDNQLLRGTPPSNIKVVFFWTAHASHSLMINYFSKMPKDVETLYVTATSVPLLEEEMQREYWNYLQRKKHDELY